MKRPTRLPTPRTQRRLIAVGLVVAVSMFSGFVHLVDASVARGDAMRQAITVSVTPR